jgi:predicted MFS family arabinose efflux permease
MATIDPFRGLVIVSIFSALYILSVFYRVSNAIIAPNLYHDLGLNAETLGILGGSFFYSLALFQIPLGPMLDRIGPRFVVTCFSLIGALGAFLFAFGQTFTVALIGRILNGVGMACVLMGALKVFTLKFPENKFTTLMGIVISLGTLGNILAASPLAFLSSTIGWRKTFFIVGVITILFAFLIFWVLGEEKKDRSSISPISPASKVGILPSIRLVLGSLNFWKGATVTFFRYGTFVSLQGLWLGPYLMDGKGYSAIQAGNILILLSIGMIIGAPIAGRLSDRTLPSSKGVVLWGLSLYCLSLFPLVGVLKIQSTFWYGLIFFFVGFFNTFGMGVFSNIKELFPITISGTVMTLLNFFHVAGAAILMQILGRIIEFFPKINHSYPVEAYHLCFLICFLTMASSLVFYGFSKKHKEEIH